ncbi:glycosyltransferase family 4 protein [Chitinilyticum litopenaei]|uniref:glycosyltransferase family 4 protein n=1 Tax=Chitinilyticum litopenaei TaxID=1121276 RepID=UPI0005BCCB10|nr:glycosyltransferase family 4 protein [Chitinilyticum litopenaei]
MRVLVTASIAPFIHGGADYHVNGVCDALRSAGCQVELLRFPFTFQPEQTIMDLMEWLARLDLRAPNNYRVDKLISLQFPGYGAMHDDHVAWVMHQHRAVYELYDPQTASPELAALREKVVAYDQRSFARCKRVMANSQTVADRLRRFNGVNAEPLYHPPPQAEALFLAEPLGYVFCPSRIETLKRQDLLVRALALAPESLPVLFAGDGGQRAALEELIAELKLESRVRLLGRISDAEKRLYYAHADAVFFAPFDEDYGYITHEAMLSGKPVITCSDSGGPLEFVRNGETGWVVEPDPQAVAEVLQQIRRRPQEVKRMGLAARMNWSEFGISWTNVVNRLLEN